MELHHRCGVYACWNPDHLQIVTHAENMAFARNTAKSCCKRGHALSGENLRVNSRGPTDLPRLQRREPAGIRNRRTAERR